MSKIEAWREDYQRVFTSEQEDLLNEEIALMEHESRWMNGYPSNELRVIGIKTPIEASMTAARYGMDLERTLENAGGGCPERNPIGTGLILEFPETAISYDFLHKNISRSCWGTLCETAKLNGSALGRMVPERLAETLNNGLEVARGDSLILLRYDKIYALHSGSEAGYCIMPISNLLEIARTNLSERFGAVEFDHAYHSNTQTTVLWTLPDAQSELIEKYQSALSNAVSRHYAVNFMPGVVFSASDTAKSSAILKPVFIRNGDQILSFGGDVAVKHEKRTGNIEFGTSLFDSETKNMFCKFDETMETIKKMAETEITNPVNCFVGIINWLNRGNTVIKRAYADNARQEIENLAINGAMSMHDIYLAMAECISAARIDGVKNTAKIEEALAKVLTLNWPDFDVGGTVAWGDKPKAA